MWGLITEQMLHRRSRWVGYLAALVIVGVAYAAGRWTWPSMQVYPFFFYFPAVFLSAVLFNHRAGYVAAVAAAVLVTLRLEPWDSFWIAQPRDQFAWLAFLIFSLFLAALVEELRRLLHRTRCAEHEARAAEQRACAAEEQKDLFLREAVHRFKNDLTIVASLLRTQERRIGDGAAKTMLVNTTNRVQVMARVHDRLRIGPGAAAEVNTREFIEELCADLQASLVDLRPVAVEVRAEPHPLPHDQAVAVGLIINEAVTNALKYAFPDERSGTVSVSFVRRGPEFLLRVKDDGIGFDPERAPRAGGIGRRLVQSMAQQLGGQLTVEPDEGRPGTVVSVTFPQASDARAAEPQPGLKRSAAVEG
ncbi:Two-component sensor histidine kinase, contains HisKA and HATPase domains [Methylobacterium sp. UNC378MF]|uniref:sensor histidine kinase n=1 Tax=Methylobacterium sp. UNC378MF TaxID=1502748 RepID=UPI00088CB0BA|nr:histidine kinase dimerization/phosphoacceptor domain -containing protein [Methylobacterium sp. UNC378MF]SDA12427.1 Two-component sensor histidine kinase, contains HisKA and HATPase domains [Methylobacterium sp. UNC378MF]